MNAVAFLFPAFVACLVLTGIHTYLGIHVISRGVIFVDIALAQMAALGMTVAHVLGFEPDSQSAYFFALAFTSLGALLFTYFKDHNIHQEALIGVTFAVSSALMILLADRVPHGSEHIKYILNGSILWVGWPQILKIAVIYAALGVVHYFCRKKLLLISDNPQAAQSQGLNVKAWDLFFYLTFGLVITSSVQIGGILLVFSFLIVPALCSLLFFSGLRQRIFLGWLIGTLASVAGIYLSYRGDLPTGAAIVTVFGIALVVSMAVKNLVGFAKNRK